MEKVSVLWFIVHSFMSWNKQFMAKIFEHIITTTTIIIIVIIKYIIKCKDRKEIFFLSSFFPFFLFFFLSNKNDVSPIIFNKYQTQHYILNSVKFFSTTYIYIYTYTKYWYNRVIFLKYYRDWSKYINKMSVKVKIEHNNNETKTEWISVSFHLTIFNL